MKARAHFRLNQYAVLWAALVLGQPKGAPAATVAPLALGLPEGIHIFDDGLPMALPFVCRRLPITDIAFPI
jgi:hypothetical protein